MAARLLFIFYFPSFKEHFHLILSMIWILKNALDLNYPAASNHCIFYLLKNLFLFSFASFSEAECKGNQHFQTAKSFLKIFIFKSVLLTSQKLSTIRFVSAPSLTSLTTLRTTLLSIGSAKVDKNSKLPNLLKEFSQSFLSAMNNTAKNSLFVRFTFSRLLYTLASVRSALACARFTLTSVRRTQWML